MKNSTKLKLALLKEFGGGENDVRFGMKAYEPHSEENEYLCKECGAPMMYEDEMCKECGGIMQEGEDTKFMSIKTLEHLIDNANELMDMIQQGGEIPAWIVDHIIKSGTFLDQAADAYYSEGEQETEEEPNTQEMNLSGLMEALGKSKKKRKA